MTYPQAIQDLWASLWVSLWVSFFSLGQIWINLALNDLLTSGSSAVNGCRQNESSNSWLKRNNNPQVIHTPPVHQLTSCEAKGCMFVRNKSIIKDILTSNRCFWLKWVHNNTSSRSHLIWIRREICTDQAQFTSKNSSKQICGWILIWEDNRGWTFFTQGSII